MIKYQRQNDEEKHVLYEMKEITKENLDEVGFEPTISGLQVFSSLPESSTQIKLCYHSLKCERKNTQTENTPLSIMENYALLI